jgi:hypothetical protein
LLSFKSAVSQIALITGLDYFIPVKIYYKIVSICGLKNDWQVNVSIIVEIYTSPDAINGALNIILFFSKKNYDYYLILIQYKFAFKFFLLFRFLIL